VKYLFVLTVCLQCRQDLLACSKMTNASSLLCLTRASRHWGCPKQKKSKRKLLSVTWPRNVTFLERLSLIEPPPKRSRPSNMWERWEASLETGRAQEPVEAPHLSLELEKYLLVPRVDRMADPCAWWRENETCFPTLFPLARVFLASRPSSVFSERLFSCAGNTLTAHRSRLLPKNAEKLLFIR
jgi:hypothetical protein